jgi:hypothetical protein
MKPIITLLFILSAHLLAAQQFKYPAFPSTVKNLNACILPGWFLKDSVTGDLSGDAIHDFAIVIESKDTLDEMRPDSMINRGNPRILLIGFYDKKSGRYRVVLQHNSFITRYGEGGMVPDAFVGLTISDRVLTIILQFIRQSATYKFRYQQNDFYLIGAISAGLFSTGQFDNWDINFSTKKVRHTWGHISEEKEKEEWLNVPDPKLKKLKEMTMPFQWEVFPNVYL